jgi:transposase
MRTRFGERFTCFKCQKEATYYRVKGRRAFECEHCGYQVYPTAGTPFDPQCPNLNPAVSQFTK